LHCQGCGIKIISSLKEENHMIKIWGWDKKPRTMLRFIKPGDIFCFRFDENTYCFGRIISKVIFWTAEIFDYVSPNPEINEEAILKASRLINPVVLDAYCLFDRRTEGEWRIIGRQEDYTPQNMDNVFFTYGVASGCKKVDIWNNETPISAEEQKKYIMLSPDGDYGVKELLKKNVEFNKLLENVYGE